MMVIRRPVIESVEVVCNVRSSLLPRVAHRPLPVMSRMNVHSSNFQLTPSLAFARGVTYDCPRIAKAGAALALGPRVSVARTHVLPTLRRIWWLAGRQQAAPLPGERQKPAMLVSRVGTRRRVGRMHPDGPESDSDLRRAQRRRERPPERSGADLVNTVVGCLHDAPTNEWPRARPPLLALLTTAARA